MDVTVESDRWRKIKDIFQGALEMEPGERASFLARACGGDKALLGEVESLLNSHFQAGDFIEKPVYEALAGSNQQEIAGTSTELGEPTLTRNLLSDLIPDYELLSVCGEGAFGRVWIVKDRVGSYRAMKVIEMGKLAGAGVLQREWQALGEYCRNVPAHPNLIQVFHIGQNEQVLYYTMELADDLSSGSPIPKRLPHRYLPMTLHSVLERAKLTADQSFEIVLRLTKGAARLHETGLVHRDIKPANVVFVQREVKLADISLVSVRRKRMSRAGTPQYMPPDECMDASADTYALGKMLYELISGGDLSHFPRLPQSEQVDSQKIEMDKLAAFLVQACAHNAQERFSTATVMHQALWSCRNSMFDSPLLELADSEASPAADGMALSALQKAITDISKADSEKDTIQPPPTPQSSITGGESFRRVDDGPGRTPVWEVVDRLIKILPWVVLLTLGYYLIYRLTR